jgi:hypothetical protein
LSSASVGIRARDVTDTLLSIELGGKFLPWIIFLREYLFSRMVLHVQEKWEVHRSLFFLIHCKWGGGFQPGSLLLETPNNVIELQGS